MERYKRQILWRWFNWGSLTLLAEEQPVELDFTALEKAIADAERLKEEDYTAQSWQILQSVLAEGSTIITLKESYLKTLDIKLGVFDYIMKQVEPEELIESLKRLKVHLDMKKII